MIRIEKIQITKFRGIVDLELELSGENFAACGPNGTGKSGIVDAIEFALTGSISRLSGRGTGGLSVKQHGPHVDYRNKPEQSSVQLDVLFPSLGGKKASIIRTVKAANAPIITPADPDVLSALDEVRLHPEFVLSRRELIRYVIAEPSDRSKEVQALLRLDDVEKLRTVLQKIANAYNRELAPLERAEKDATASLLTALQLSQLTKGGVLEAANTRRAALGLARLMDLTATTSLTDGLESTAGTATAQAVPKAQAAAEVAALRAALQVLVAPDFAAANADLVPVVKVLAGDRASADGVKREALLNAALEMYDDERCPVCDTEFDSEQFTSHLKAKLAHLDEVAAKRKSLATQVAPIITAIHAAGSALATVIPYGAQFKPPVDVKVLLDFKTTLGGRYKQLDKLLPLADTAAILEVSYSAPDVTTKLAELDTALTRLPDPSSQDAAKTFLTIAQERLAQYRNARQKHLSGKARAERAAKVYEFFGATTTKALEDIYKKVQNTFSELYREINRDDESGFTAKLIPSLGKLGFDVDFYGRGDFPPGAYHSEGHQDGMGLCLYLALMSHLLGDGFTFAVLDDVLMSVDRGHRREVCTLLKTRFPNTQFIFTTHDEVWLRHMQSEAIIKKKNCAHFKTWSVDVGPAEWTKEGVWEEIGAHVAKNEISVAGGLLRRYLEYLAGEASHRLRGKVEYKGDGQFVFGDLITGATAAMSDAFKKAKNAATSWGQTELMKEIGVRQGAFDAAKSAANVDQWQINTSIHYNPWADLDRNDFTPVVVAYKEFTSRFSCPDCNSMLSATPEYGTKLGLRCDCGSSNLNFTTKPGGQSVSPEQTETASGALA